MITGISSESEISSCYDSDSGILFIFYIIRHLYIIEESATYADNIIETISTDEESSISTDENFDCLKSKDGTQVFQSTPYGGPGRIPSHNILKEKPGFKPQTLRNVDKPLDAFLNFFTPDIMKVILDSTNAYISSKPNFMGPISENELLSFIGTILLIGLLKGKNAALKEYFSDEYGIPMIRAHTTFDRCKKILTMLRFDIPKVRNRNDRIAPIRNIFEKLIRNCQNIYTPNADVTIDEQLVTFRGRCKFKMYIPSKPGRHGIKIWAMCDSKNSYLYNAKIYAGKENNRTEINQGENVVKELSMPIYKTGRNITMDNFFTSCFLARYLLSQKITIVGTVRKNKAFLPISFQSSKGNKDDSQFIFQKDMVIVKYCPKKNKSVVLLSTLHSGAEVNADSGKPEIIHYYNVNKGGVDTLDQLARYYSCKRSTRRWPLAIFMHLIDVIAYNSLLLYTAKHPIYAEKYGNAARREFLKDLTKEMIQLYTFSRPVENSRKRKTSGLNMPARCELCSKPRPKTRVKCERCDKFVCFNHREDIVICNKCCD